MNRFILAIPTLSKGDAMGHDVLEMARILRDDGHTVEVIAKDNPANLPGAQPASAYLSRARAQDVLIYHHGTHWPEGMDLFQRHPGPRVLRYHNVTPPELFRRYSHTATEAAERGRQDTFTLMAAPPDWLLADSPYNARELHALGAPTARTSIVPPFHLVDDLRQTVPDATMLAHCQEGGKNILTIGRIVPNKGHLRLIEALAVLQQNDLPTPRLLIAGKLTPDFNSYHQRLLKRIEQLQITRHVEFILNVTAGELRALYAGSHAFAIASDHEGFCVPLVEAMAFGLPIIALGTSAIPDTLADAGIVWLEDDPRLWAATFARVLQDEALAAELRARGLRRYEACFSRDRITAAFRQAVRDILAPRK